MVLKPEKEEAIQCNISGGYLKGKGCMKFEGQALNKSKSKLLKLAFYSQTFHKIFR